MDLLKLIAFDGDDLSVVSAHLQDAVVRVGDMALQASEKRFAAVLNRVDWAAALGGPQSETMRRQAALRFERVLGARLQGIDLGKPDDVLSLLAISFTPRDADDPSGTVLLTFAGSAALQLEVECLEVEMRDLGPAWRASSRPQHPENDGPGTSGAG